MVKSANKALFLCFVNCSYRLNFALGSSMVGEKNNFTPKSMNQIGIHLYSTIHI